MTDVVTYITPDGETAEGVEVSITEVTASQEGEPPVELIVIVPVRATILEVKEILAKKIKRKEVLKDGKFVMCLPNGDRRPMVETQKLGPRRKLMIMGCQLTEPPPELPPAGVEDFDPYSTEQLIESPRTLQACDVEGVDPEELFFAPVEEFKMSGLHRRLARLRHDFFESYRLDTVNLVRHERNLMIKEEQLRKIHGEHVLKRRPLEQHQYPITHAFFEDVRSMFDQEKLWDRPQGVMPHKLAMTAPKRWETHLQEPADKEPDDDRPQDIRAHVTTKGTNITLQAVEEASGRVAGKIAELQQMHAGSHETVSGLPLQSQTLIGPQMYNHSQKLKRAHKHAKKFVKQQASMAEVQQNKIDDHLDDVLYLWELREKKYQLCQDPWENGIQEANAAKAAKREDYWQTRRDVHHVNQLAGERERKQRMEKIVSKEVQQQRKTQNMKYLTQIHYARNFTERRTRWGANRDKLAKADEEYRAVLPDKHLTADARVKGQKERLQAMIEYKREYKSLRKKLTELAVAREEKRQALRKEEFAEEGRKGEADSEEPSFLRTPALTLSSSSPSLPYGRSAERLETSHFPSPQKAKRYPRFNWGRFGAEAMGGSIGSFATTVGSEQKSGMDSRGFAGCEVSTSSWNPGLSLTSMHSASEPVLRAGDAVR